MSNRRVELPSTPTQTLLRIGGLCLPLLTLSHAPMAAQKETKSMSEMICGKTALEETMCMIEAALRDIKATYRETGGGGISEIKFLETKTLMISIAQEERVDQITYAFDIKANRRLVLLRRTEGTKSPRR